MLVVVSKVVSRAEDRFVDLSAVTPSQRAETARQRAPARTRGWSSSCCASRRRSRAPPAACSDRAAPPGLRLRRCRHRLQQCRRAGCTPPAAGPWALLCRWTPDRVGGAAARCARSANRASGSASIVSDSHGTAFSSRERRASRSAFPGLPALWDRRGERDRFGRMLEHTQTALADQLATARRSGRRSSRRRADR